MQYFAFEKETSLQKKITSLKAFLNSFVSRKKRIDGNSTPLFLFIGWDNVSDVTRINKDIPPKFALNWVHKKSCFTVYLYWSTNVASMTAVASANWHKDSTKINIMGGRYIWYLSDLKFKRISDWLAILWRPQDVACITCPMSNGNWLN